MDNEVASPPTQPPGIKKGNVQEPRVKLDISN